MKQLVISTLILVSVVPACTSDPAQVLPPPAPVYEPLEAIRIAYGSETLQFGELRLPEGEGSFPVIMIVHGGCWLSQYDLTLMDSMAHDLATRGFATWNIEYRRTGDPGGGWPGTFTDVAEALRCLNVVAKDYPLDLDRLLVTGHSAGGHLALMLGAQDRLDATSVLRVDGLPALTGIVSLAGITDLSTYYDVLGCGSNTDELVGGTPEELPDRYAEGSPITYLPLGVPQILVNGESDNIVTLDDITPYFERAQQRGEEIELVTVPNAGHFEVITPGSIAWPAVVDAFNTLLEE
ncbi:MAG: alpha/beta hydrolase [Saprospiraceae bacterium]|nr:alpha/beta hydrolase [Saprospiraceae bacterium]